MYWLAALSIGFLGSAHCVGMCGPILLATQSKGKDRRTFQALHHGGRLLAYAIIGAIAGAIGQTFNWMGVQQSFSIVIGSLMVLGVVLYPFTKRLRAVENLLSQITMRAHQKIHGQSWSKPFTRFMLGMANGILPCGLVYLAMAGAANTFTPWDGGLFMLFFGLGTLPALAAITELGKQLSISLRNKIRRLVPITIFVMGCLLIVRGMNLGIPYMSPQVANDQEQVAECH